MRAYQESSEEAVHAHDLLKDWKGEGFLTAEQYQRMERETVCDLRRTNIFLRLALLLFTLLIIGAAVALFFSVFHSNPGEQTVGFFLLIFAVLSYAGAEAAVREARLYRHGVEEALAICSVGFLCAAIEIGFLGRSSSWHFLVPLAGAIGSVWIWHRFGLPYASLAAIIFAAFLPGFWTSSAPAQRLILAALYAAGLVAVAAVRKRYRFTYLDSRYSIAEALLWLGIYLAINLQLSTPILLEHLWDGLGSIPDFPKPSYWATWALIWCLPPIVLARGLRSKDRFVIWAGGIAAILTLVTNKPYLGWPRHTWDPMLLGVLLIAVALLIRRRLAQAPDGIRYGFTAQRLSGKDKQWMSLGSTAIGLVSPAIVTPSPQANPEFKFGGGDSGGGGASSDF